MSFLKLRQIFGIDAADYMMSICGAQRSRGRRILLRILLRVLLRVLLCVSSVWPCRCRWMPRGASSRGPP